MDVVTGKMALVVFYRFDSLRVDFLDQIVLNELKGVKFLVNMLTEQKCCVLPLSIVVGESSITELQGRRRGAQYYGRY